MEQDIISKKKKVSNFLKNGLLINKDILESDEKIDLGELNLKKIVLFDKESYNILKNKKIPNISWFEFEKSKVMFEKKRDLKTYKKFLEFVEIETTEEIQTQGIEKDKSIRVLFSYDEKPDKKELKDFVLYFNARFRDLKNILKNRLELHNTISINRILNKTDKENVSLIGIVKTKKITKNKNLLIVLEDPTGEINILVNQNKTELYNHAKDIVLDEVIGVSGKNGDKIVFVDNIIWPDIPIHKELKKTPDEVYSIFLSDLHVGSNNFLEGSFLKFIKWIKGESGNKKQQEIAGKVKYVFLVGDLVDGVGVFPGQKEELIIEDINDQYEKCVELLKQIPEDKKIIICPGNHDAMRIAEPQLPFYKDFTETLWELPNTTIVSNPSFINIHSSENFSGIGVLLYHGYSFDYYVANVDSLRIKGGYDRADLIMKFLLKRRHLAPTHTSTQYIPDNKTDPLVIKNVPDIFASGHIHKSSMSNYRNITLVSGSCWQSKTSFQEKVGHHPEPARVPIINLHTREMKV